MDAKNTSRIRISEVRSRRDHAQFLALPYRLYRNDPTWVPPLRLEEARRWDPDRNPSLAGRPHWRFLAWRGESVIGRICASLDPVFAERWRPGTGLFGFFECENDHEAALALLTAVEQRLSEQGAREILGPVNLTSQDEVGMLTSGYADRPRLLSPYNPPWYPSLLTTCRYMPLRRYHAYAWSPRMQPSATMARLISDLQRRVDRSRVILRKANPDNWDSELRRMLDLYNRAFDKVWGYTPISWPEFRERAERFRPFYQPDLVVFAERGEELVGFGLALPDINILLQKMHGRLLPFGWLRMLTLRRSIRSVRYVLLAVRPDLQGSGLGLLVTAMLMERARELGIEDAELSLVDENNAGVRRMITANGCSPVKTYTLFSKAIKAPPVD